MKRKIALLHAHGTAGPRGRRSYLKFGTFGSRREAEKEAKSIGLDGARYVPASKLGKTKHPKLVYIKK